MIPIFINIQKAGTLKEEIKRYSQEAIHYLKLSGYLNGDDIIVVREIIQKYNLTILDIADVAFVSTGGAYGYTTYNETLNFIHYTDLMSEDRFQSFIGNHYTKDRTISAHMFEGCNRLFKIVLPDNIDRIEISAFEGCTDLREINIPRSLQQIDIFAFRYCYNIKSFSLPEYMYSLNIGAFADSGIQYLTLPKTTHMDECYVDSFYSFADDFKKLVSIKVGEQAVFQFENCPLLEKVQTTMNYKALSIQIKQCPSLLSVVYNDCITYYDWRNIEKPFISIKFNDKYLAMNKSSFKGDEHKIKNIDISSSITYIEKGFFYQWENLENITIGNGIEEIGDKLFFCCPKLKSVTLGNKTRKIGRSTFYKCINLKTILLSPMLQDMEDYCFYDCEGLEEVKIPNSVYNIG